MAVAEQAASEVDAGLSGAQAGGLRTCAVSREERPTAALIRFVADPDGVIVPDLARRLPGRGVWVELSRVVIEEAVKRRVFAKSLKRAVEVPSDLAHHVEDMVVKRVAEAFSIANKAGLVVPGTAQIDDALEAGVVVALFHGVDAAAGGTDKLDRKLKAICAERGIQPRIVTELTIDQMSLAMGRSNVVHAGLLSGGATTRLLDEAERLVRFRASPVASLTAF